MKPKVLCVCLSLMLLLSLAAASAVAGDAGDPVVALSYINETYLPSILSRAEGLIAASYKELDGLLLEKLRDPVTEVYAAYYISKSGMTDNVYVGDGLAKSYRLGQGSVITGTVGSTFILRYGNAVVHAPDGGTVAALTLGGESSDGVPLEKNGSYMVTDEGAFGIRVTSDYAILVVTGTHRLIGMAATISSNEEAFASPPAAEYTERFTSYADALNAMRLFMGTAGGYSLSKEATRAEALTMLIRILGEEADALAFEGSHPFTDVVEWADRYVAYGYAKGYTNGTSATLFGSSNAVTQEQYLTFLLRALGYSDTAGDFVWSDSAEKVISIGMLTAEETYSCSSPFLRDQLVFCSYRSLYCRMKNSKLTLIDKLLSSGCVTHEQVSAAADFLQ